MTTAAIATTRPRGAMLVGAALWRGAWFALFWWLLTEGRAGSWGLGSIAILAATGASLALLPPGRHRPRPLALLRFAALFAGSSILGAWQVAWQALRGPAALRPTLLEYQVRLASGGARVLLVSTLGLMPGTVGVELDGDRLRIHALDGRLPVAAEVRALEDAIAALFGAAA